jgi:dTDP-4-dehydrorhamnose 3,5-epimerase-like enzyme
MPKDDTIIPEIGKVEFDFSEDFYNAKIPTIKEPLLNVRFIKIEPREDDRGFLLKDCEIPFLPKNQDGMPLFGEHYNIFNPNPMIRGFHAHRELWDIFCAVLGKVKFVLFDARISIGGKPNPTYMKGNEYILSERTPRVLVVPPGIFHGHRSYAAGTLLSCVGSHPYNPKNPDEVRVPYTSFGYNWEPEIK